MIAGRAFLCRSFICIYLFFSEKIDYVKELKMMIIDKIALILTIIGAVNWGSIGLFKFDIVAWICGGQTAVFARIIYIIVFIAGLWCISLLFRKNNVTTE